MTALRYLDYTYPSIEANLALDEALLIATEEQAAGPTLRVWEPSSLAIVLGASCRLHDDVDVASCEADRVPIGRRSSGGGTVVVGPGTLNVTVVLPSDFAPGLTAVDTAQAYVLERTALALRRHGPEVGLQGLGDLTLGDRKVAGSAQRRLKRSFLIHTSVLYRFPIELIARYTRTPARQPAYRDGRPHVAFLTNLNLSRDQILSAVRSAWLAPGRPPDTAPLPDDLVRQLVRDRFDAPGWVERF